jgi:hypothetical protein
MFLIFVKILFDCRDTGVYIKVNCISTEFTPKKHGGEKGVPFRLQVSHFFPKIFNNLTFSTVNST